MDAQTESKRIQQQFRIIGAIAIVILLGGMVFYHFVEKLSWVDALYFCTITLTTVGYGDISPQSTIGKLFTVLYVFVGIGIIATFANLLIKNSIAKRRDHHVYNQKRTRDSSN